MNLIINKETPQALDTFYQTTADEISICEMRNLLTHAKQFKAFPSCDSKEILYYIEPTPATGYYHTTIVQAGVNDLLNDKLPNNNYSLTSNLVNIVKKCKSFGVENLFIFGIASKKASEKIEDICENHAMIFIDNGNISNIDLY